MRGRTRGWRFTGSVSRIQSARMPPDITHRWLAAEVVATFALGRYGYTSRSSRGGRFSTRHSTRCLTVSKPIAPRRRASGPARACLHQPAKGREPFGNLPSGERCRLVQGPDLALDERQVLQRVEDHVPALVRAPVAGDDVGAAPDHHPVDVATYPHPAIPVGDRDGIVVVAVAHQGLRAHLTGGLMTGVERRRRQRGHGLEVKLQALADALAVSAKNIALALAAAALQILVEHFEAHKARLRRHEVASRPTHQALHRSLVVGLAGAPVPERIPNEPYGLLDNSTPRMGPAAITGTEPYVHLAEPFGAHGGSRYCDARTLCSRSPVVPPEGWGTACAIRGPGFVRRPAVHVV